jgi:signal peptidase I
MLKFSPIKNFILPNFERLFFIRVVLIALGAYLFFGYICIPFRIQGSSMEPTYHDGGFNFCWRLRYLFSEPKRGEVVTLRFAGKKVMLLKRIVALENDKIEFIRGKLYINDRPIDEPYVKYPCTWNLSLRRVRKDYTYVIGDNRNMQIENHYFGQASMNRITGGPLW